MIIEFTINLTTFVNSLPLVAGNECSQQVIFTAIVFTSCPSIWKDSIKFANSTFSDAFSWSFFYFAVKLTVLCFIVLDTYCMVGRWGEARTTIGSSNLDKTVGEARVNASIFPVSVFQFSTRFTRILYSLV